MTKHTKTGNCFLGSRRCERCGIGELCDVCHEHCMPRGECDECPDCDACTHGRLFWRLAIALLVALAVAP